MKKATFVALLYLTLILGWSCSSSNYSNPYTPGYSNTPTPIATSNIGATFSVIAGPHYALAGTSVALSVPITITHGQSVVWDNTNNSSHPLNIDNGAGSCVVSGNISFPVTETFNSTGTFQFHCGNHSSCGNGTCPGTCTGNMVGTLQVN